MEDAEILSLLRAKDARGMEALMGKYGRLIRYVVSGVLQNTHDAEECVNDIYLSLWEKAGSFDGERGSLSTWLTTVARNAARNLYKAAVRREKNEGTQLSETHAAPDTPERQLLRGERTKRLQEALSHLSPKESALLYRKYYYMQSTAQIAAELGLPPRAVEGRLYRLRKRLQKELGGDFL